MTVLYHIAAGGTGVKITVFMKAISLNLDEVIFGETEKIVAQMKKPRNRYLKEAFDYGD